MISSAFKMLTIKLLEEGQCGIEVCRSLESTDSTWMLQQLCGSAGAPYLLDRSLGCHSTKEPRWGILHGLSHAPMCSFIPQGWLIIPQELSTGMSLCQTVFQAGWKCPEMQGATALLKLHFQFDRVHAGGQAGSPALRRQGRVTCCSSICSHLALTATASDARLHLGWAVWGISVYLRDGGGGGAC